MIMLDNLAFIVPNNFAHKAGDGVSTRKHHLKDIHPALMALPGGTQKTYVLMGDSELIENLVLK